MTLASKPRRPFGVTLALAGGVFIFSVIPLLMIATIVYLSNYVRPNDVSGGASGIEFTDFAYGPLLLPIATSVLYLVLAGVAWRGKPAVLRFVFPLVTAVYCIVTWGLLTIPQSEMQGLDSGAAASEVASQVYLGAMIGVTIYIAWFMNRWSARAFYRGYYTKNDLALLQAVQNGPVAS